MQIRLSVRNAKVSEETREHITKACAKLEHFCEQILDCEVIIDKNKEKIGFAVELVVMVPSQTMAASACDENLYKALAEAQDRLEVQLRKHHDKLGDHR